MGRYYSQIGQDKWITEEVFPGLLDGFYVDVGSSDGIKDSNTRVLEELGWRGICVDPYPKNMEVRHCELFREVVYSKADQVVQFRLAEELGGIENTLGFWKHRVLGFPSVELQTTTINDILRRAAAPSSIHYMSIDVEGAEFEVLRGLSFEDYRVTAFTIEHSWETEKRQRIRELLESKGYSLAQAIQQDDCYLHNSYAYQKI